MIKKVKTQKIKEQKDVNLIDEKNKLKEISLVELIPNSIENVIIHFDVNGKHALYVPSNMSGEALKSWMKGRGGAVLSDVREINKNTAKPLYYIITKNDEREIIRIINEDEIAKFSTLRLIDGIIGTSNYMLVKKLDSSDESINQTKRYIEESAITFNEKIITSEEENINDIDYEMPVNSISLFEN